MVKGNNNTKGETMKPVKKGERYWTGRKEETVVRISKTHIETMTDSQLKHGRLVAGYTATPIRMFFRNLRDGIYKPA